jgi:hypothetical protein
MKSVFSQSKYLKAPGSWKKTAKKRSVTGFRVLYFIPCYFESWIKSFAFFVDQQEDEKCFQSKQIFEGTRQLEKNGKEKKCYRV